MNIRCDYSLNQWISSVTVHWMMVSYTWSILHLYCACNFKLYWYLSFLYLYRSIYCYAYSQCKIFYRELFVPASQSGSSSVVHLCSATTAGTIYIFGYFLILHCVAVESYVFENDYFMTERLLYLVCDVRTV